MVLLAPFSLKEEGVNDDSWRELVRADVIFDYRSSAQLSRSYKVNSDQPIETLLVTQGKKKEETLVYELNNHDSQSYRCKNVSDEQRFSRWTVPAADWLDRKSQFFGQFPLTKIGAVKAESSEPPALLPQIKANWWKSPIMVSDKRQEADWLLFDTASQLPFRMMIASRHAEQKLPLFGEYSLNYFLNARQVKDTNLELIKESCESGGVIPKGWLDFDGEIKGLEFREADLNKNKLPSFQHSFESYALMTPIDIEDMPFPTRIQYDWNNVRMYTTLVNFNKAPFSAAFLKKDGGRVTNCDQNSTQFGIQEVTLGAPKRNWMEQGQCKVESVIKAAGLQDTLVIGCPVKDAQSPAGFRTFWMWYSEEGTPYSFMESEAELGVGTSLAMADYYKWHIDKSINLSVDADKSFCKHSVPQLGTTNMPIGCYGCHGGSPKTEYPNYKGGNAK